MAFFDGFGRAISDAGQAAAERGKELTAATRLNREITLREREMSRLYARLGEVCYRQRWNADADAAREIFERLDALSGQIERDRAELRQVKGVGRCPTCGADIPADALYCSYCGARLAEWNESKEEAPKAAPSAHTCPICGSSMDEDRDVCVVCGAKLEKNADA